MQAGRQWAGLRRGGASTVASLGQGLRGTWEKNIYIPKRCKIQPDGIGNESWIFYCMLPIRAGYWRNRPVYLPRGHAAATATQQQTFPVSFVILFQRFADLRRGEEDDDDDEAEESKDGGMGGLAICYDVSACPSLFKSVLYTRDEVTIVYVEVTIQRDIIYISIILHRLQPRARAWASCLVLVSALSLYVYNYTDSISTQSKLDRFLSDITSLGLAGCKPHTKYSTQARCGPPRRCLPAHQINQTGISCIGLRNEQ